MNEKARLIIEFIRKETTTDPVAIFHHVAAQEYVNMHGPEHHIVDGAALLMAFYNAGGKIDIDTALQKLAAEGLRMPGATCGLWGVCGAVTSMGAALAIIDGTGPLSNDGKWGEHMRFTSSALADLAEINGPRCCKRDAFVAFRQAIAYVNSHYPVTLMESKVVCTYSARNQQCIGGRCPFHEGTR